ncbi:hypothetical protein SEUCBS139899_006363 [Sporothrix eucalyptigena]|uniref:Thioesterase domain-containing protein n=1 Tax=Sporothrix eucalyptigena TaxID=1812306 RepID=A0ABP0BYD5_9PEZI
MVVRIPASALASARSASSRSSTVSSLLLRRCLSQNNYQPPQYATQPGQPGQPPLPQYFPPQPPPPPPKKRRVRISTLVFLAVGASLAVTLRVFQTSQPRPVEEQFPRGTPLERDAKLKLAQMADKIQLVKVLEADPDWDEWDVGKRWSEIDAKERASVAEVAGGEIVDGADVAEELASTGLPRLVAPPTPQRTRLTTGALGGVAGMGGYHRIFHNHVTGEIVSVLYIGRALNGWPGVTHGGALATILDEALGRCAILAFPARTGVTARLELSYRNPAEVNNFYVVWCTPHLPDPAESDGKDLRKLWCTATLDRLDGTRCVEARGLFVVPRGYKLGKVEDKF